MPWNGVHYSGRARQKGLETATCPPELCYLLSEEEVDSCFFHFPSTVFLFAERILGLILGPPRPGAATLEAAGSGGGLCGDG